jgi:hypothetical protein
MLQDIADLQPDEEADYALFDGSELPRIQGGAAGIQLVKDDSDVLTGLSISTASGDQMVVSFTLRRLDS